MADGEAFFEWEEDAASAAWASNVVCSGGALARIERAGRAALAVCASGSRVSAWNVKTGACEWVLPGGSDGAEVLAVAVHHRDSSEADLLSAGYADGSVRVWDVRGGAPGDTGARVVFSGHRAGVGALSFSGDGVFLASGARDGSVVVWDVAGERGVFRATAHTGPAAGAFFVGGALVSVGRDGAVRGWDVDTQHCTETLSLGAEVACVGADCRDGHARLVSFCVDGRVRIVSVDAARICAKASRDVLEAGLTLLDTLERAGASGERVSAGCVSADGRYAAVLGASGALDVWRLRDASERESYVALRVKKALRRAKKQGKADDSGRNDSQSDSGSESEDTAKKTPQASALTGGWAKAVAAGRVEGRPRGAVFASDWVPGVRGSVRLTIAMADNCLAEATAAVGGSASSVSTERTVVRGHRGAARVAAAATCADGAFVLATASRDAVCVWVDGSLVRTMTPGASAVALLCDGAYVLVGDASGVLKLASVATGETVGEVRAHDGGVRALAAHAGGFASAGGDGAVKAWAVRAAGGGDAPRLRHVRTLALSDAATALAWSSDGALLAVGGADAAVRLFDGELRPRLVLYGHRLPVCAISVGADHVLTAGADKTWRLWSRGYGECMRAVYARAEALAGLAALGGSRIAVAGRDGSVRFFAAVPGDRAAGAVHVIRAHVGEALGVFCSSDGRRMATLGSDRAVRFWRATDVEVVPGDAERIAVERAADEAAISSGNADGGSNAVVQTLAGLSHGERLADALDAADALAATGEASPLVLAVLRGETDVSPGKFVCAAMDAVPPADVAAALLCLGTRHVHALVRHMDAAVASAGPTGGAPLRFLDAALRLFVGEVRAAPALRPHLLALRARVLPMLRDLRDFYMCSLVESL